jgi:hypothetical protein
MRPTFRYNPGGVNIVLRDLPAMPVPWLGRSFRSSSISETVA